MTNISIISVAKGRKGDEANEAALTKLKYSMAMAVSANIDVYNAMA